MKTRLVGNTHIVEGSSENIADVLALLRREGIETNGNPDVYVKVYRQFGIDDARELRERASLRALGERRIFIVAAPDINREAQNALLKTLEEPPENALFFFILPSPDALLPTLRSRVQILRMSDIHITNIEHPSIDIQKFLAAAPQKRLDMLKPLLEKDEDDPSNGLRTGKRDMGEILAFLTSLENKLQKCPEGLIAVYRARKFITDKGALVKPLLEQAALLVPPMS
mgnify:CR=1 FL=1